MHKRPLQRFLASAVLATVVPAAGAPQAPGFNSEVRPIISDKCFACHGPDAGQRKGDLRLDVRDDAIKAGAIAPGDPGAGSLLKRVVSHDADELMPPPDSKLGRLEAAETEILRRWIEAGAEYEPHWAFVPVPDDSVPPDPGKHRALVRNPIDNFVFSLLSENDLQPQPEADRATLIRRLSFDLTGLPPTSEEVVAFVNDQDPEAYGKLVDRLLASPRYGERMATDWLDLARYADSYGHQVDRDRDVWPWRDWVISAFNRNLPYDEFLTWQLAGDLLENPTDEQLLATTFNRLHQQKVEGGSIEEEFRVEYVCDRVNTFGTAFLGLTLDCSRCHDHKFDPVSQSDYYSFFAFFQNIDESGLYSYFTKSVPTPAMTLATHEQKAKLAELNSKVETVENHAAETQATASGGELCRFRFDGEDPKANSVGSGKPLEIKGANKVVPGRDGGVVLLTGDDPVVLPVGNFPRWQPFSASLWIKTPEPTERAVVFHRSKAWTDAGSRGYELLLEDGRLKWSLIHFWPGNAVSVKALTPVQPGRWTHVAVSYDGSSRADGLRILVDGTAVETETVRDHLTRKITGGGGDTISIGERMRDRGFAGGMVDEFRLFERELRPAEVAALMADTPFVAPPAPGHDPALEVLRKAREERDRFRDGLGEIMVMRELPEPKDAYVLTRGAYDARADEVTMSVPSFLPQLPGDAPLNRLGLARWLTDRSHPLTSRTAVNRFWQACFGRGLVETAEDFGNQGSRPRHPDLLDWLSAKFIDDGWDIKALMKTIVSSHTYRQRSIGPAELMEADPHNEWLARGPAHRLSAEMTRDAVLVASGLLVEKLGGPPVKPYEIAESFKPAKPDTGEGLYRRSLYTYWRLTGPAPALLSFDAVKRDVCTVRRDSTATPLQSLVLLNGTQFVEAARVLGARLVADHGEDPEMLVEAAFERLTGTTPDPTQKDILRRLYQSEVEAFRSDPGLAEAFLGNGAAPRDRSLSAPEAAAAGVLVNTLFNYDGFAVKR